MKKIFLFLTLILIAPTLSVNALRYDPAKEEARIKEALTSTDNPTDSLKLLYDLFDVEQRNVEKVAVGNEIFLLANKLGNQHYALDILRLMSACYSDDKHLAMLEQRAAAMPHSQEQQETVLFLKMKRLSYSTRSMGYEVQQKKLSDLVNRINNIPSGKEDSYTHLLNLYTVAAYMRHDPESGMLKEYMDSLYNLVNRNDYKLYALKNIIYSEAANIYSDAGYSRQAVEADKKLLGIIENLEQHYRSHGRTFRNFDISRYVVYRRMIRNYRALTPAEVQHYHAMALELAANNEVVAEDIFHNNRLNSFYYMSQGRYADAIPMMKKQLETEKALPVRMQLLEMLQTAARNVGDSATLVAALTDYNALLSQVNDLNASNKFKELQVAYDVSNLKAKNTKLLLEKANAENASVRKAMSYLSVLWIIIVILLVFMLFYWSRHKRDMTRMREFSDIIKGQRDKLKSTRYLDNDQRYDPEKREAMKLAAEDYRRKTNTIRKNDRMETLFHSILTDMIYISALSRDDRMKHIHGASLQTVLRETYTMVQPQLKPNVTFEILYPEQSITVVTDVTCLKYTLSRIVEFAQNVTADGVVHLRTSLDSHSNELQFIFTHTGIRIPTGSEEVLFDNFISMKDMNDVPDSALLLCRLNAFLLTCRISYNPHVDGPAQLIISIPLSVSNL